MNLPIGEIFRNEILDEEFIDDNLFNTFTGGVPPISIYQNSQLKKHFVGETEVALISKFIKEDFILTNYLTEVIFL